MKYLFILNDSPYGNERTYNGLRMASSLSKQAGETVSVFLMGDAVGCSVRGQNTPNGYYNLERMLKFLTSKGCAIGVCGSCLDARGTVRFRLPSPHKCHVRRTDRPGIEHCERLVTQYRAQESQYDDYRTLNYARLHLFV